LHSCSEKTIIVYEQAPFSTYRLYPVVSLVIAGICFLIILIDLLAGRRQPMWIMNVVWPVTALYAGPIALWAYWKIGRVSPYDMGNNPKKPFWQSVGLSAMHCGSGCTLGDLIAEWILVFFPFVLFSREMFASWVIDYILALIFGIAFQYYSIKPMSDLSPAAALIEAVKADVLSLTSWQLGMYGWMAIAMFAIFGHGLDKTGTVFWFMMQIGMLAGFMTSYPVNWGLVKAGIKKAM
jgi:hypothetical protein